jgi:protein-S-isoprenylcysteine O-methyltransferase Ste14
MRFLLRGLVIVVALTLYLGLAVARWGGTAAFFADPARVALAAVLLGVSVAAVFAGGGLSRGVREDRENRWVLSAFGITGLALGIVPAWTERVGFWTLDGESLRWIGVVLFALGCVLRLWPVFVLGDRFSGLVAIQPGHTLVTTGIYGTIRHPSYLGLLVSVVGWALAFRSAAGLMLTALLVPPLVARIHAEERLLGEQFGPEYEAYRARTSRLLPGVY